MRIADILKNHYYIVSIYRVPVDMRLDDRSLALGMTFYTEY